MKAETVIEILRRAVCLIALGAYSVCLYLCTVLGLGYTFEPLIGRPWQFAIPSISLRWVPLIIYFWLRHRAVTISALRRSMAVALAVISISLSYFLISFGAGALHFFVHGFLECTMDMWPAIVMLLAVTRKGARSTNSLPDAADPVA